MNSTAKFSSLLLWLVVHRQGETQPGCEGQRSKVGLQPVLERDAC